MFNSCKTFVSYSWFIDNFSTHLFLHLTKSITVHILTISRILHYIICRCCTVVRLLIYMCLCLCSNVHTLLKIIKKQMMGLLQIQNDVLSQQIFLLFIKIRLMLFFFLGLLDFCVNIKKHLFRPRRVFISTHSHSRTHTCVFAQYICIYKKTNKFASAWCWCWYCCYVFLLLLPHNQMYTSSVSVGWIGILSLYFYFYFYFSSYVICIFNYVEWKCVLMCMCACLCEFVFVLFFFSLMFFCWSATAADADAAVATTGWCCSFSLLNSFMVHWIMEAWSSFQYMLYCIYEYI